MLPENFSTLSELVAKKIAFPPNPDSWTYGKVDRRTIEIIKKCSTNKYRVVSALIKYNIRIKFDLHIYFQRKPYFLFTLI